jgi:hypothetical protein
MREIAACSRNRAGGAARPWLHADQGGEKMSLLATDKAGIEWEKNHNHSDFDRLYYFVEREEEPCPWSIGFGP